MLRFCPDWERRKQRIYHFFFFFVELIVIATWLVTYWSCDWRSKYYITWLQFNYRLRVIFRWSDIFLFVFQVCLKFYINSLDESAQTDMNTAQVLVTYSRYSLIAFIIMNQPRYSHNVFLNEFTQIFSHIIHLGESAQIFTHNVHLGESAQIFT